ncbi:MAG TPA: hypothetical protein GXZ59_00840 [Clostridiaceae bacterium]|nr:hypothetical protein [Clostridiaceae bacterium]
MIAEEHIDMITEHRDSFIYFQRPESTKEPAFKPDAVVQILLTASDSELLGNVNRHLCKQGIMGLFDMSGRVQYILDGRKGASFAANKFSAFSDFATLSFQESIAEGDCAVDNCIDTILRGYGFRTRLRGYALLKRMLRLTFADPALLRPATKRLYPQIAKEFRVNLPQIERNMRYMTQTLLADEEAALSQGVPLSSKKYWLSQDDKEGRPTVITTLVKLHNQVVSEYKLRLSQKYKTALNKEKRR